MISFTNKSFESTFCVIARRSVRKVLDRLINSESHESRSRLERDYSTSTSTDLIISKNESEEKKMSDTMDPQGSKDGHQEAFEYSPSKERGVCCDGACCTARTQLLDPYDICCGCFKPVHDACCRTIDEDDNRMCAACDTKPKGKSDASSSATEMDQEQD
jgi:hypothetical protein